MPSDHYFLYANMQAASLSLREAEKELNAPHIDEDELHKRLLGAQAYVGNALQALEVR